MKKPVKEQVTASELLGLAFKQLALKYGCWISSDKELLHRTIFNLQQELGEQLHPLQEMHFAVMGAYPYSSDLFTVMWMLYESGHFDSYSEDGITTKVRITIHDDTEEFINKELEEIFGDDPDGLKVFHQFVEGLKILLVSSLVS